MTRRPSFRDALAQERPLITPLAHDALSARLIEQAGFKAFAIGGSALLAARYALPDIGLIGLSDMLDGMRNLASATNLPFIADADDGYGDAKNVARLVHAYEALGVGGFLLEDQHRDHKQQRADKAAAVVEMPIIEGKIRTALRARTNPQTFVIGRTDAYGALGLDEALRRAKRYLDIGSDGVFVAGLRTIGDYERVGRELSGAYVSAAMFEVGGTPWLTPKDLGEMGFSQVSFPTSLLFPAVGAMRKALSALRSHADGTISMQPITDGDEIRQALDDALGLATWRQAELTASVGI